MKKVHSVAGAVALATLALFWLSTALSEVSGNLEAIVAIKRGVVWGLLVLIPALALTGASGMKIGGRWKSVLVATKKRRMPFIAANGLLVLVPCALTLRYLAVTGSFGPLFYALQALELVAGATNILLLALNARDGLRLKSARRISPAGF